MRDCAKHLLYALKLQAVPVTHVHTPPTTVFNNTNGAVFLSKETAVNSQSNKIDIQHHFICDLVKGGIIIPAMIDTKAMPADYVTKATNSIVLRRCQLLVGNISQQESNLSVEDP